MAVWEMRAVFQLNDRSWENVWHVDVGAATDVPAEVTNALIAYSRAALLSIYTLARVVRRPAGTTDAFIEVIVDELGTRSHSAGLALPLFNVVRILLQGGVGRPGLKFLRGFLLASDIVDDNNGIAPALIDVIRADLDTFFNAVSTASCNIVYGADNKFAVNAEPDPIVKMRQQHRKRKKSAV